MIAQVDEQHAAVVTHPMDPTREANGLARMVLVEIRTGMAAIGVHSAPLSEAWIVSAPSTARRRRSQAQDSRAGMAASHDSAAHQSTSAGFLALIVDYMITAFLPSRQHTCEARDIKPGGCLSCNTASNS